MATPAQRREAARQRKANQRARDNGELEPYPVSERITEEEKEERLGKHQEDLAWAKEQDEKGFYGPENRSCVILLGIYEGNNALSKEEEKTEETKTGRTKKENRPNPSKQKIQIKAIETEIDGKRFLIEPDSGIEYRKVFEVDEVVSFQRWLDLRAKARKDLLWLGRLLGKGLFHSVHQQVCDMFVKKDFTGLYFPGFNIDDFHDMFRQQKRFALDGVTPCQEMILLDPRGAYKSTIDGIDAVQWLINAPDVRIMIITAFKGLAGKFAKEIKNYFYLASRGEPTPFQLLFPEYVLTGIRGRSKEPLDCPAAHFGQKEPNMWVTSLESSSTGMHCDVRKADDVVDPKNSDSEELREDLKFKFDGTDDLLDQWGFSDIIGTRYFTTDWYGTRMSPDENGDTAPYAYHCRGSWVVKPPFRDIPLKKLEQHMVDLLFPYKLSWRKLKETLTKKGERSFKNQQMNEATDPGEVENYTNNFTLPILQAHMRQREEAPKIGDIFICWDWALSANKTSDYSAGVAAIVYQREDGQYGIYLLDLVYGKWKESELLNQIIAFYKKWKPKRTIIENSNGGELLQNSLKYAAQHHGVPDVINNIFWKPPSNDDNAKRNRIKGLEILLMDERLHFVMGPWLDELFVQMVRYTGEKKNRGRKDDLPDALSYLCHLLPASALRDTNIDPEEIQRMQEQQREAAQREAQYKRIYGSDGPAFAPAPKPEPINKPPDTRQRLLGRIFGGNGMRA